MNVGGCNQLNRKSLQLPRDLRKLAGDLRRHLSATKTRAGRGPPELAVTASISPIRSPMP